MDDEDSDEEDSRFRRKVRPLSPSNSQTQYPPQPPSPVKQSRDAERGSTIRGHPRSRSSRDTVRSSISSRSGEMLDLGTALKSWSFDSGPNRDRGDSAITPKGDRSRKNSMQSGHRQSVESGQRMSAQGAAGWPPASGEKMPSRSMSTMKRLSSLSKKHRRKVSDGWNLVSGAATGRGAQQPSSTVSTSTWPTTASASVDSGIDQQEPPTPKARRSMAYPPPQAGYPSSPQHSPAGSTRLGVPLPARSSSHNAATASTSVRVNGGSDEYDAGPSGLGRRSSLGDLRIPSRVVTAQKGIREGIGMVKQFAAGIKGEHEAERSRSRVSLAHIRESVL
jgi:hypothetical protein